MTVRRLFGALLLLCALALLIFAATRVRERGRFAVPYSTYGAGPDGTRALLLLARSLGHDAQPINRELTHLPRGTLVLVAGCKGELLRPIARPEREALAHWVDDGGLLIVAGRAPALPEAGLHTATETPCVGRESDKVDVNAWAEASAVGPPLTHLLPFVVRQPLPLRVAHDAQATELLASHLGPLGLTAPFGRGRVVLLGIPDELTNAAIADGGGLVFARLIKAFAPAGPVLFDEYHLGMGERRSVIGYLRDRGYAGVLLQLLCAVLIAMFLPGVRLLPARNEPAELPGARRTFLDALSTLFARTRDHQGALTRLAEAALKRVADRYRVEHSAPDGLAEELRRQGLHAVASYAQRIQQHGRAPLASHETLHGRADQIARDEAAALVIGESL